MHAHACTCMHVHINKTFLLTATALTIQKRPEFHVWNLLRTLKHSAKQQDQMLNSGCMLEKFKQFHLAKLSLINHSNEHNLDSFKEATIILE